MGEGRSGGDGGDLWLQETESIKTHLGNEAKKRDRCMSGRERKGTVSSRNGMKGRKKGREKT